VPSGPCPRTPGGEKGRRRWARTRDAVTGGTPTAEVGHDRLCHRRFQRLPAGMTTVRWVAREAAARHLPVVLLHSWSTQPLDVPALPQEARSNRP
jgi:hypothetical protein